MKKFQALVFDDVVDSSAPQYVDPSFNDELADTEELAIFGVAVALSGGAPTLTVQFEESPDQIHWRNKKSTAEIAAAPLSLSTFTNVRGRDSGPSSGFARLRVEVGGTSPRVRVKLWVATHTGTALNPMSILGLSVLQWVRSDLGIVLATGVQAWGDASGNGHHYIQPTPGAQPVYTANDATLNGQPSLTFDGTDDKLVCSAFALPAPATTPTWVWMVVKSITWTHLDRLVGDDGASRHIVYQEGTTPQIAQFVTVAQNNNGGLAVGSWGAVQAYFSASAADFVAINDAAPVTGASSGDGAGSGSRTIAGDVTAGRFGNIAIAELVYANALPNAGQIAAMAAYRRARYGF